MIACWVDGWMDGWKHGWIDAMYVKEKVQISNESIKRLNLINHLDVTGKDLILYEPLKVQTNLFGYFFCCCFEGVFFS